jgi:ATP-dependent Clp protease, protease subunit
MKPPFVSSRVLAASEKTLEITMYGDIGEDWWTGEGITPKSVKQQIDDAGEFSRLTVRINSPGGSAFDGVAIYNVLRAVGKPVSVVVDGIAASAASIIAMAGDTVTMGRGSMLMLHNPWTFAMGNAKELRNTADMLEKVGDSMADVYVAKSAKTLEQVKEILDEETWLSAQDAVDEGFADEVAASSSAKALAAAKEFPLLSKLRNVPDVLKTKAPTAPTEAVEPEAPKEPKAPTAEVEPPKENGSTAALTGPPAELLKNLRVRFDMERLV